MNALGIKAALSLYGLAGIFSVVRQKHNESLELKERIKALEDELSTSRLEYKSLVEEHLLSFAESSETLLADTAPPSQDRIAFPKPFSAGTIIEAAREKYLTKDNPAAQAIAETEVKVSEKKRQELIAKLENLKTKKQASTNA